MNEQQQAAYEIVRKQIKAKKEGAETVTEEPNQIVFLRHKKGEIFSIVVSANVFSGGLACVWRASVKFVRNGKLVPTQEWSDTVVESAKTRARFELLGVGETDFGHFLFLKKSVSYLKKITEEELLGITGESLTEPTKRPPPPKPNPDTWHNYEKWRRS